MQPLIILVILTPRCSLTSAMTGSRLHGTRLRSTVIRVSSQISASIAQLPFAVMMKVAGAF